METERRKIIQNVFLSVERENDMEAFEMQVFELLGWTLFLSGAYGLVCDFIDLLVEKANLKPPKIISDIAEKLEKHTEEPSEKPCAEKSKAHREKSEYDYIRDCYDADYYHRLAQAQREYMEFLRNTPSIASNELYREAQKRLSEGK